MSLDDAIKANSHSIEAAEAAFRLHKSYWETLAALRLQEQEILSKKIANAKGFVELQTLRWEFQQRRWTMYRAKAAMRADTKRLERLRKDVRLLLPVVPLTREFMPSAFRAWRRISALVSFDSMIAISPYLPSVRRSEVVNRCMESLPEFGSLEHLALCEVFSLAGPVAQNEMTKAEERLRNLGEAAVDIWKA